MDIKRFVEITKDSFTSDGAIITEEEKEDYDNTIKSICLLSGLAFGATLGYLYYDNKYKTIKK